MSITPTHRHSTRHQSRPQRDNRPTTIPACAGMTKGATQKSRRPMRICGFLIGRSERIRTSGPCLPKTVLYQAELHSDAGRQSYSGKLSQDQRQKCTASLAGQNLPGGREKTVRIAGVQSWNPRVALGISRACGVGRILAW